MILFVISSANHSAYKVDFFAFDLVRRFCPAIVYNAYLAYKVVPLKSDLVHSWRCSPVVLTPAPNGRTAPWDVVSCEKLRGPSNRNGAFFIIP